MHFFTQAASGALPLCLAPHIESLIYPETFAALISAAIAGTVESARTTKNAFMLAPCDRIGETTAKGFVRPGLHPGKSRGGKQFDPIQPTGSGSALV